MDNKKMYKNIGSIFWWVLTALPLVIAFIYFIGYHLTFNSGISSATELANYHTNYAGDFLSYLETVLIDGDYVFSIFGLPFLNEMFYNLFETMNVGAYMYLAILFGWMSSVQFYHLLFDFIVWLPNWFHKWLSKVGD